MFGLPYPEKLCHVMQCGAYMAHYSYLSQSTLQLLVAVNGLLCDDYKFT